jgi:two-component system repressor protein LuxO
MAMHTRSDGAPNGRLLLVDRDEPHAHLVAETLTQSLGLSARITTVTSGRQAADLLRDSGFDIVLADLSSLGDLSDRSDDAVTRLVRLAQGALVVALSDGTSVSAAVGAMRAGAHDYVAKPINGPAMVARIGELAQRHGKGRTLSIEAPVADGIRDFAGFIGASSAMQFVYEQIGGSQHRRRLSSSPAKAARARMCVRRRCTPRDRVAASAWWPSIAPPFPAT